MTCVEARAFLGAYQDGELDLVRTLDFEAHCRECAACKAALETQQQLSALISSAPYYQAAPRLRARLEQPAPGPWRRPAAWLAVAASVAIALLMLRPGSQSDPVEQQIVLAHLQSLRAGHVVDVAASGGRAVRPWFATRLDFALDVENISGRGFVLLGGRLESVNGRSVAVLVYRRGPHIVDVFVWPASQRSDGAPAAIARNGLNIVKWRTDGKNWWAISDLNLPELEELPLCPCFMPVHETLRSS